MTRAGHTWGTPLPFGPYRGRPIEEVLLMYPDFIAWQDRQPKPTAWWSHVYDQIDLCIARLDARPFVVACQGRDAGGPCGHPATCATLSASTLVLGFWCDNCGAGCAAHGVGRLRTYRDALRHVEYVSTARRGGYREVVRQLHAGKGLVGRRTARKIYDLFYAPV